MATLFPMLIADESPRSCCDLIEPVWDKLLRLVACDALEPGREDTLPEWDVVCFEWMPPLAVEEGTGGPCFTWDICDEEPIDSGSEQLQSIVLVMLSLAAPSRCIHGVWISSSDASLRPLDGARSIVGAQARLGTSRCSAWAEALCLTDTVNRGGLWTSDRSFTLEGVRRC